MAKKPDWLTDPAERKRRLIALVECGVSRKVIRAITGWSNNQMAGFSTQAGIVFAKYTTGTSGEMKRALKGAGFDLDDIDTALETAADPPRRASPTQKTDAKKGRKKKTRSRKAKSKVRSKPAPAAEPPLPSAPEPTADPVPESASAEKQATVVEEPVIVEVELTPVPEESEPVVTDEEVAASTRAAITTAARESHAEELAPVEPRPALQESLPTSIRQLPRRFIATVVDPESCRAPVAGDRLGGDAKCGAKPVVYAGCCEEHADRLFGKKWRDKIKQ